MIRREWTSPDGQINWLLISQVEHARISGQLARGWNDDFSEEVLAAITHHDDGWAAWEADPQLDAQHGRPLSFMEMAIADAVAIWDRSIWSARDFGPLAGALVAGHFLGLAQGSEQASDPVAENWLRDMADQRAAWLAEWDSASPTNTLALAERGQQMLLAADLLSLWLCCDGPVSGGDADGSSANTEMKSRTASVLGKYRVIAHDRSVRDGVVAWQGSLQPWPFATDNLRVAAPAIVAPVGRYPSWRQLVAVSQPIQLSWQLKQTLPPSGKC